MAPTNDSTALPKTTPPPAPSMADLYGPNGGFVAAPPATIPDAAPATPVLAPPSGQTSISAPPKSTATGLSALGDDVNEASSRVWDAIKEGIPLFNKKFEAASHTDTGTLSNGETPKMQVITPEAGMTATEKKAHPIATGIAETAGGLTSPGSVATIAATGGFGELPGAAKALIPKLVSLKFSYDAIKGAYDQIPAFKAAMDRGDASEAERIITHIVLDSAMGVAAGQHATEDIRPDVAGAGVPDEQSTLKIPKTEEAPAVTTPPTHIDMSDLGATTVDRRGPVQFGRTKGTSFGDTVNGTFNIIRKQEAEAAAARPEPEIKTEGPEWDRTHSAYIDGKKVGSVGYKVDPDGRAQVYGSNVDPSLRGQGIGQKLYQSVINEAEENGADRITSDSTNTTPDANRVWDKLKEKGAPIEDITHPNGKAGKQITFNPKPVDLSDLGGEEAGETPDHLLTSERQSDLKQPYTVIVKNEDGTNRIEMIDAFSSKDALKQAQKKFPEGGEWSAIRAPGGREPSTDYSVPKGKLLSMPDLAGKTPESTMKHEIGHAMIGQKEGLTQEGILRHTHPDLSGHSSRASVRWPGQDLFDTGTRTIKPEKRTSVVNMMMGGIAADEVFNDTPRAANHNFDYDLHGSDARQAYDILKEAGFKHDEILDVLHKSIDSNKEYLQRPEISGIVKENAGVREAGLSKQFHMSSERLTQMHAEAQRRMGNEVSDNGTTGSSNAQNGEANVASGKGTVSGADGEVGPAKVTTHEVNPEEEGDESFNFGANEKSPNADIPESKRTPTNEAAESAQRYNAAKGQPQINHEAPPLNEGRAQALAAEMDTHAHEPNTPAVKKAYKSLIADVKEQWNHAQKDMGIKFEPSEKDPYTSYDEVKKDVEDNKHMSIYTGGNPLPEDHPLAQVDPKTGLTYNTMLRGVHDLYGHIAGNNDFSEQGEAGATNAHRQMMSPASVPALLNETEGQVSQYFHGKEKGGFPPQNATLVPENFVKDWHQEAGERAAKEEAGGIDPRTGTSATEGVGSEILPERRQALDHAPTPADFKSFYEANRDVLDKNPDLKIGWDNNSKVPGGHEINIGIVGDDAARLAKKLDQTSAFDIGKGEVIPTKGSGLRTEFPNYSLEERIKDAKGEPLSNVKDFEHLSKDFYDHLEPDEREYLKGNKTLQRNAMSQYHKIDPSVAETTNAMASGAALGGWWQRYMDVFHGLIPESESPTDAMYHGTPSGDLRGGTMGLHVGTKEAATQALESRIGIRADGKPWDGTQEYGKTLLAGKRTLDQMDPQGLRHTGYNADLPQEDHYPTDKAKYSDGTPVAANAKPNVMPVKITGAMKNSPKTPVTDLSANRLGKRGSAQGAYYKNIGEDAGSISAMVPNGGHIEQIASTIGPSHAEVLKQWHAAVSGNKSVEDANNLAWHSYADWLDAGKPTDRTSINNIVKQNAAQPEGSPKKGNAAISDTLDKNGKILSEGLDTSKLFKLVNSPEMRGERPFSNDAFNEKTPNALVAKTEGARKIPSMGATVAGKGNLNRLVIDAHIRDFYGRTNSGGPAAQYIADSVHLRQAAEALGLKGGEGQEQLWGTVLGLKQLLKTGLTPEEAAGKLNSDVINQIGKDYAEVIANDPEITKPGGLLDRLKEKYGVGSGSAGVGEANRKASASRAGQAESRSSQTPVDQNQLAKTAERIKGQISESKIKKPAVAVPAEEVPATPKKAIPAEDPRLAELRAADKAARDKRAAAMKKGIAGLSKPGTK